MIPGLLSFFPEPTDFLLRSFASAFLGNSAVYQTNPGYSVSDPDNPVYNWNRILRSDYVNAQTCNALIAVPFSPTGVSFTKGPDQVIAWSLYDKEGLLITSIAPPANTVIGTGVKPTGTRKGLWVYLFISSPRPAFSTDDVARATMIQVSINGISLYESGTIIRPAAVFTWGQSIITLS